MIGKFLNKNYFDEYYEALGCQKRISPVGEAKRHAVLPADSKPQVAGGGRTTIFFAAFRANPNSD